MGLVMPSSLFCGCCVRCCGDLERFYDDWKWKIVPHGLKKDLDLDWSSAENSSIRCRWNENAHFSTWKILFRYFIYMSVNHFIVAWSLEPVDPKPSFFALSCSWTIEGILECNPKSSTRQRYTNQNSSWSHLAYHRRMVCASCNRTIWKRWEPIHYRHPMGTRRRTMCNASTLGHKGKYHTTSKHRNCIWWFQWCSMRSKQLQ